MASAKCSLLAYLEPAPRIQLAATQVKIHCSVLAEEAIQAAIADYKTKQDRGPAVVVSVPREFLTKTRIRYVCTYVCMYVRKVCNVV